MNNLSITNVRAAFKRWAEKTIAAHGLSSAVKERDEVKITRVLNGSLPRLEAEVLLEYIFPEKIKRRVQKEIWPDSTSNAGRKRRQRERNQDKIVGDQLSRAQAKVTRSSVLQKLTQHATFKKNLLGGQDDDADDADENSEDYTVKEVISLSSDVIFVPATQTTRYSAQREAKRNLERRMHGYEVDVLYGSGEGLLRFYAKATLAIPIKDVEQSVIVNAEAVASPTDMALHKVEIIFDEKVIKIEPADTVMFPEEAVEVLYRIAENCVKGL